MHIPNVSVASIFQQLQSLAGGALDGAGFGGALTGQNLPAGATATGSAASTPLGLAPSSQFASSALSALISAQESQPQNEAAGIIQALNPNGNGSLSLGQVEQALTGSPSASSSPQQLAIAGAFAQLDANGDGQLSQSELAQALTALQSSDPSPGMSGHHHRHHHLAAAGADGAQSSTASATSSIGATALALSPTSLG
jgi:EF-hand domain